MGGFVGNGVQSVDNEFLYVNLAQGRLGIILLWLIVAESVRTLAMRSWRLEAADDRAFAFSMLAAMAVLWIALYTVYMGGQLPQLAFLLMGWGQSIMPVAKAEEKMLESNFEPKFFFRRVFS